MEYAAEIRCMEAFNKRGSFEGWRELLPRGIRPSDIDMVIDYNGRILFFEFKSNTADWKEVPRGQKLLYRNIVLAGQGQQAAVLCHVEHSHEDWYHTINDVVAFSLMTYEDGKVQVGEVQGKDAWPHSALDWLGIDTLTGTPA